MRYIYLLLLLVIAGCNGSGEPNIDEDSTQFYSSDVFEHFTAFDDKRINLKDIIHKQGNQDVKVMEINGSEKCIKPQVIGDNLVIYGSENLCVFKLLLASENKRETSEVAYVISNESEILPVINADVPSEKINQNIKIELNEILDSYTKRHYTLSDNVYIPKEFRNNYQVDVDKNIISFIANKSGVFRIYYQLNNNDDYKSKLFGYININISNIKSPIAHNVKFKRKVKAGESITLDISNDEIFDHNPVESVSIPKENIQLTDVYIMDKYASTKIEIFNKSDLNNKKFNFKSQYQGVFFVSYYISDHFGGSDVGIIEITVEPAYDSIFVPNVGIFSPPITYYDALGTKYSRMTEESFQEDGSEGPIGLSIGIFKRSLADDYCKSIGFNLATGIQLSELEKFSKEKNIFKSFNWPTSHPYLAVENRTVYDFSALSKFHGLDTDSDVNEGYFSCVKQIDTDSLHINSKDKILVGSTDKAYMSIIIDGKELIIPDEFILYETDDPSIIDINKDNGEINALLAGGPIFISGIIIGTEYSDSKTIDVIEQPVIKINAEPAVMITKSIPISFDISYDGEKTWAPLPKDIIITNVISQPDNLADITKDGDNSFSLTGKEIGTVTLSAYTDDIELEKTIKERDVEVIDKPYCNQFGYFDVKSSHDLYNKKFCLSYGQGIEKLPGMDAIIKYWGFYDAKDKKHPEKAGQTNPYIDRNDYDLFCQIINGESYILETNYPKIYPMKLNGYDKAWNDAFSEDSVYTQRLFREKSWGKWKEVLASMATVVPMFGGEQYYQKTWNTQSWTSPDIKPKDDYISPVCLYPIDFYPDNTPKYINIKL